jgi:hypothetical protein
VQVLRLEVAMPEDACQTGSEQPATSPLRSLHDDAGHEPLILAVEQVDGRPHEGIGVIPTDPARVRQRRVDMHVNEFRHPPREDLGTTRSDLG